jgi:hypothetical protein
MTEQQKQNAGAASADLPPAMAEIKSQSADEVLKEMNRMPLFMTTLDETDGEGGENMMLEALRAIAYEGTRYEIAENFRQQGNECARAKQWTDAKEFYDKAIAALKGPQSKPDPDAEAQGGKVIEVELDEEEEAKKEKVTEEACYINRALCNLEKSKSTARSLLSIRWRPSNTRALSEKATILSTHVLAITHKRRRSERGDKRYMQTSPTRRIDRPHTMNNLHSRISLLNMLKACSSSTCAGPNTNTIHRELPLLHKRLRLDPSPQLL